MDLQQKTFVPWIDRLKEFPFGLCIIMGRAYTCAIVLLAKRRGQQLVRRRRTHAKWSYDSNFQVIPNAKEAKIAHFVVG
jgi:hypothetical protein